MKFTVLTLFPEFFTSPLATSLLGKAVETGKVGFNTVQIRDFATDKHHTVDDTPYGGGSGMVMKPEPIVAALGSVPVVEGQVRVILSPRGERLTQKVVRELASASEIVLLCGRYEGFDERVVEWFDREVSLGDFVLSGGEPAGLALIDAITRLVPGVMGNQNSAVEESFSDGLLEYPQYTRPPVFHGREVPPVLISGNHAVIRKWRRAESLRVTQQRRPELLDEVELTPEDQFLLDEMTPRSVTKRSAKG
jgi:tRNA (guanine37-N1)-methyltransferase